MPKFLAKSERLLNSVIAPAAVVILVSAGEWLGTSELFSSEDFAVWFWNMGTVGTGTTDKMGRAGVELITSGETRGSVKADGVDTGSGKSRFFSSIGSVLFLLGSSSLLHISKKVTHFFLARCDKCFSNNSSTDFPISSSILSPKIG